MLDDVAKVLATGRFAPENQRYVAVRRVGAAVPRIVAVGSKKITLLNRYIVARARQQNDVTGAIAKGPRREPLHPLIEIDQVGTWMSGQILHDRDKPSPS